MGARVAQIGLFCGLVTARVPLLGGARTGLSGEDLQWLLEKVPAEVLVVRPLSPVRPGEGGPRI